MTTVSKKDMVETIADKLLEDHMALMAENNIFRAELATLKTAYAAQVEMKMMAMDELESLRPAAEALKTAVELRADILIDGDKVIVGLPSSTAYGIERGSDPLSATIKCIARAAEAVKENGK